MNKYIECDKCINGVMKLYNNIYSCDTCDNDVVIEAIEEIKFFNTYIKKTRY